MEYVILYSIVMRPLPRLLRYAPKAREGTLKLHFYLESIRAIGTNYNQVVKELRSHFSEKKAMALLYKLEKCTEELAALSRRIVELSKEMEEKWSPKSV